jgi:glycyl-tRNA synthetase beta chain
VALREKGVRHDVIDAVLTPQADDLLLVVNKARALQTLIDSDDGRNLLAAYKRAANILAIEGKKGDLGPLQVQEKHLAVESEHELAKALNRSLPNAAQAVEKEEFSAAMAALAALRGPIDSFFEDVLVNDPDPNLRLNRLALLARFRAATATVADFGKISG